jgi:hypothetical protein
MVSEPVVKNAPDSSSPLADCNDLIRPGSSPGMQNDAPHWILKAGDRTAIAPF